MYKNKAHFSNNFVYNTHNTRSGDRYVPSHQRLQLTLNQSIMYQAPLNWSDIPLTIKNANTLKSFKSNYKKHLISQYMNDNNQ